MQGLDRHITGNYGEDSVPPEFVWGEDLDTLTPGTKLEIGVGEHSVVVTPKSAVFGDATVYLTVEELQFPLAVGKDAPVRFADDDD
jgi:hypothetical protein